MKVHSIAHIHQKPCVVEVEVTLLKGLPQIHILGMPDRAIRENERKIRCALKQQGFEFPRAKQVLVNLRPAGVVKSSRGLDLAIALGILMETGQIPKAILPSRAVIYGELSLRGEIFAPGDWLEVAHIVAERPLITGALDSSSEELSNVAPEVSLPQAESGFSSHCSFGEVGQITSLAEENPPLEETPLLSREVWPFSQLRDWQNLRQTEWLLPGTDCVRPRVQPLLFSATQARQLQILSLSKAHALLAGPAGAGKTTLMTTLPALAPQPSACEFQEIFLRDVRAQWRPVQQPHHSMSVAGFLGGGSPFQAGCLYQAHNGFLLMDELLEFRPDLLECLRQPLAGQELSIERHRSRTSYFTRFQMIATTNLCPCGDWFPGQQRNCHYSRGRCLQPLHKLSGPLLDRFHILLYLPPLKSGPGGVAQSAAEILATLDDVRCWREVMPENSANEPARPTVIPGSLEILLHGASQRRREALSLIARTCADLEQEPKILPRHWEEALDITVLNFLNLKKGD